MAVSIPIPDSGWTKQTISLAGKSFVFDIQYNTRSKRWYLGLELNGKPVIKSLKIIENVNLTGRYILSELNGGNLYCIRYRETSEPAGRNNVGIGKDYELVYLTDKEISEVSAQLIEES